MYPQHVSRATVRHRDARSRRRGNGAFHRDEHLIQANVAAAETLDEISRVLKIDDDVMRHLATRRYKPGSTQPVAVGGPGREDVAEPIDSSLEEE